MPADPQRVQALFHELVEHVPPAEWPARLAAACGDDAGLCGRVQQLLDAHGTPDPLLDAPDAPPPTVDHPGPLREGSVIGPYKLLQRLGAGGMGEVWVAQQKQPVQRLVALKIIKPGMDTRQVIARFEAEEQALALMDHPNIAKVFDAGTTPAGHPYFAMELVKGVPITQYCDERGLTVRQRLELFLPVCQAVQHAHQKGIIHRDLKPSNVLVTEYDEVPVPKVIDFGIAKAVGPRLTDKTIFTEIGSVIGTLEYMSPEQAKLNQLDVDTRSDVYSLGVLLYELLTGTTPFDRTLLRAAALDEVLRVIREDDPPRPSARLSASQTLPTVAARRHAEPAELPREVRGELDWIVMTALEKERKRRYQSAASLAEDIQDHLHDRPVKACPPSVRYRLSKFVRRYRWPVAAGAAVLAALVLGIAGTTLGMMSASHKAQAEAVARKAAEEAELRATRNAEELEAALYIASMNAAQQAYDDKNFAAARHYLDMFANSDLRGLEWHWLQRRLQPPPADRQFHFSYQVHSLRFSPSGQTLAIGLANGKVAAWHKPTGKAREYGTDRGGRSVWRATPVVALDDRQVIYGTNTGVFELDLDSGNERCLCEDAAGALDYCPRANLLASGGLDKITLWTRHGGGAPQVLNVPHHQSALSISSDGRYLAAGDAMGYVTVWDLSQLETPLATLELHGRRVSALSFSPRGDYLASVSDDNLLKVWNWQARKEVLSRQYRDDVRAVRFSPDGRYLACGNRDGTVTLWKVTAAADRFSARLLATPSHQSSALLGVDFSPDSQTLALGSSDRSLVLYNIGDFETRPDPGLESDDSHQTEFAVLQGRFLPGSRRVVLSCDVRRINRRQIVLWDLERNAINPVVDLPQHQEDLSWLAVSQQRGLMAVGIDGVGIQLYDVRQGCARLDFPDSGDFCRPLAISADGTRLAAASAQGPIRLWELPSGQVLGTYNSPFQSVTALALSPDGTRLAVGSLRGEMCLLEPVSGQLLHDPSEFAGHTLAVLSLVFSPDGHLLASGGWGKEILLWDVTGQPATRAVFQSHLNTLDLRFSHDGKTLFSADSDMTVKVWDVRMRQLRFTFRDFKECVNCLDISEDDKTIVTGGRYGEVRLLRGAD